METGTGDAGYNGTRLLSDLSWDDYRQFSTASVVQRIRHLPTIVAAPRLPEGFPPWLLSISRRHNVGAETGNWIKQASGKGGKHSLTFRMHSKPAIDTLPELAHSCWHNVQYRSDLHGGIPLAHERQGVSFALCQRGTRFVGLGIRLSQLGHKSCYLDGVEQPATETCQKRDDCPGDSRGEIVCRVRCDTQLSIQATAELHGKGVRCC